MDLIAVKLKTQVFTKGKLIKTIILQLENMRTLPYFATMERSFSQEMLQIARKIWNYLFIKQ